MRDAPSRQTRLQRQGVIAKLPVASALLYSCVLILPLLICATLCSAATHRIALTFDDLPSTGDAPPGMSSLDVARSILKTLRNGHVPPTYGFVNASTLTDSPDEAAVLKLWRADGNLLGNHTLSHLDLNATTILNYEQDIAADEPVLRQFMADKDWHWYRYPYLSEGETMEKRIAVRDYLKQHGYRIAQVTVDFSDYAWNDPYARCLTTHNEPAITWLKATYLARAEASLAAASDTAQLVYGRDISHVMLLHIGGIETAMLPRLLELLRRKHYRLITLAEAEKDEIYSIDPGVALKTGRTLPQMMLAAHPVGEPVAGRLATTAPSSAAALISQLDALCR